jgi:hypothetical protein
MPVALSGPTVAVSQRVCISISSGCATWAGASAVVVERATLDGLVHSNNGVARSAHAQPRYHRELVGAGPTAAQRGGTPCSGLASHVVERVGAIAEALRAGSAWPCRSARALAQQRRMSRRVLWRAAPIAVGSGSGRCIASTLAPRCFSNSTVNFRPELRGRRAGRTVWRGCKA